MLEGMEHQEAARLAGLSRSAAYEWHNRYEEEGIEGLRDRHTRPLSPPAKRRSSAAPGSLRKKYAGITHPPDMVHLPINSTTSGDHRNPV